MAGCKQSKLGWREGLTLPGISKVPVTLIKSERNTIHIYIYMYMYTYI